MAHAGDQTPKFGPAAKAAKAAAAEQLRREKEFKIARDAEKRRKDEEKMATAARQRQADKDASKREQKVAEEARKLAETRERAAAAKRELQLARGGSADLKRNSLDRGPGAAAAAAAGRGPKPGSVRGTDPSWDARDAFAPPPRSSTISIADLFGEVDVNSDIGASRPGSVNGGGSDRWGGSERADSHAGGDDWPSMGDASTAWGVRQQQQQQQQQQQGAQRTPAFPSLGAGGSSDRPPRPPARTSPDQPQNFNGRSHHQQPHQQQPPSAPSSSYGMTRTPSSVTMVSSQGDPHENAGGTQFPPILLGMWCWDPAHRGWGVLLRSLVLVQVLMWVLVLMML